MDRLGGSFGSHDAEDDFRYEAEPTSHVAETPPSPVGQDERRMQVRSYNHWASLLGDRNFPHIDDLVLESLDDFGPYSVVLDFTGGVDDPAVKFIGKRLAAECNAQDGIRQLSDVPSRSLLSRITDHYMQILANQAPIGFEAEFVNQRGVAVLYRGILLPYASNDADIDYIHGVINWKEMADQQTADELLLEIDQALGAYDTSGGNDAAHCPVETAEMLTRTSGPNREDGSILQLGNAEMIEDEHAQRLPEPLFGRSDEDFGRDSTDAFAASADEHAEEDTEGYYSPSLAPATGRAYRSVDALGNPLGMGLPAEEDSDYFGEEETAAHFDSGMKTAADYGLPDWDDEDEPEEDVEDVVDPLADESITSSLTSLVSRGLRQKKSVDLSVSAPAAPIPQAYEGEPLELPSFAAQAYAPAEIEDAEPVSSFRTGELYDQVSAALLETSGNVPDPEPSLDPAFAAHSEPLPEGLYDCLAAAREMAQAALSTEDRSRSALYAAVGRAYDFSIEAQANPGDYEELIADNGLTVQDRAPMTPIVKLVFGVDYDKTRLTEYAAVLMHAHRAGIERGQLSDYLRSADGGLKGILNAERRARKEEQGKPVDDKGSVRAALAKKLRKIEAMSFADIDDDGAEFALVMVRRSAEDGVIVLGEVPEDIPLLERAARKLLG